MFPQIAELGYSERTKHYGIDTVKEAKAFISILLYQLLHAELG